MYNLGEAVGYIKLEMGKFLSDAQKTQEATRDIDEQFDKLSSTCTKLQDVAVKAFAAISAAAVAGLGKAVAIGSQFEASMSQVAATMGMSADDINNQIGDYKKLQDAAMQMGETTKFTATQAAEALNYLALAGYDAEQSISTLPTVLNLASAGGMDLARASDMITDAASALGLQLDDMSLFADEMAKAAQSSNTSVEQLGNAILQIGGTARNLSGGITELNTALGILANNGVKSAEGGTALRQIILNLTAPTEKAAKYIEELGLQVKDLNGDVRPLNEIFRDLDKILQSKGITGSADKIEALAQIFDARQLKSATALLNNYGEQWDRLYDKIDNAEGAASRMAETMETNLRGAMTILGSTAEGLGITIYNSIEDSLKKAVQEATKQVKELNNVFKSIEMQESMQKISDAISKAIVKLSEFLSDVIPKLVKGFSDLIDNFNKISAILAGLVTTIGLAAAGMTLFKIQTDLVTQSLIAQKLATLAANAALLANPYTLVAVGVGVLVTALISLESEQRKEYEQVDKLNAKYHEAQEEIENRADAYNKQKEKIDEINNAHNEEINRVNELVSVIQKNVDETGKIISNTDLVKDAIDELNSILPVNIQYQKDQILNYENLVLGSQAYCEQLKQQAIVEANIEKYKSAATAYDEAAKKQDELTKNLEEAQAKFEKVRKARDEYGADISEFQEEADKLGMFVGDYIADLYDSAENAYTVAAKAWADNKTLMAQAESDMLEAQESMNHANVEMLKASNDLLGQQVKNGQEITGVFRSESEARIRIAEDEAEKLKEINKKSYEERMAQTGGGEIITAEEELEAALEELEVQYNTGVIATEKEYHDKRLELLDNFHGEWTKKSSNWLKQEKDFQQKYADDIIKEEENKRKEAERLRKEAEQERQREIREAEQAAKEKERLYREETNKKIEEIDRRKERDENYTDEQYIADLTALRDTINKKNDLWQDLDDKIFKYQKQITENNKKELEQQLKDDFQAIRDRKDIEEEYTNEQYLSDLKTFQATLDEETDLYKQVGKEIVRVNKEIRTDTEKTANTAFTVWEKGFDNLKSKAEKAYGEIQTKQKNLENTLNNQIELYETKTKKVKNLTTGLWEDTEVKKTGTSYLKEQLKDLEDYQKKLDKLKDRGVSDNLIEKIMGMDEKSQKEYIDSLSKMSDTSLKQYDDAYSALIKKNKEFSEKYYADEIDAFKTEWGDKITAYIETLPDDAKKAGKETIESFVKGITETDVSDETKQAFNEMFSGWTDDFTKNIGEGKIFENYGVKSGDESVDGLISEVVKRETDVTDQYKILGEKSGNSFVNAYLEKMREIENLFTLSVPSSAIMPNIQNQNGIIYQQQTQKNNTITKDDLRSLIKEIIPNGDVVMNVDGDQFAKISRKQLNIFSQKSGNMALSV